tara:strand:- start:82 stop:705 length:624 start_codon:yes stop_codon:yes gene_type:complete
MLSFKFENIYNNLLIGVDEVGRGPLAGPVVSAACHFPDPKNELIKASLFNDSKKLSYKKRFECFKHILELKKKLLIKFSIGSASVTEIDKFNILEATFLSMQRAVKKIIFEKAIILIDGNQKPKFDNNLCKTLIKGDQQSISIAAASIIAKIHRDNIMIQLAKNYNIYNWENNMGYGTKKHIQGIELKGITKHHRRSFKIVKNFIHN